MISQSSQVRSNAVEFDSMSAEHLATTSPHIHHPSLRDLYYGLACAAYAFAQTRNETPEVLDLGAGDGFSSLPFLEKGASVVAVDASSEQLERMMHLDFASGKLQVRHEDVGEFLEKDSKTYDVVVACSFLHHVPDYLAFVKKMLARIAPGGQLLLFQDPMRYDSIGFFTRWFATISYAFWRVFEPDFFGGLKRRIRRSTGVYLDDCLHDNVDYHVIRNGVDQDAIALLLEKEGFTVQTVRYWSQQSSLFFVIGKNLGLRNNFAVLARREQ